MCKREYWSEVCSDCGREIERRAQIVNCGDPVCPKRLLSIYLPHRVVGKCAICVAAQKKKIKDEPKIKKEET